MIAWTHEGSVHIARMWRKLQTDVNPRHLLKRLLFEVWADAYTQGWSDGNNDRDPDHKLNPYITDTAPPDTADPGRTDSRTPHSSRSSKD